MNPHPTRAGGKETQMVRSAVDLRGVEPLTSCLPSKRSTN
jgi:hypothetical protein